jgi:hypothetical protein
MPKHHDLTGPIPHFSGLHPYIDDPQPDWQPRHPELFDTYLDIQVGDIVVTGYPYFDEPEARLIYCEVLEIGPVKWSPYEHLHSGDDPRNYPLQCRIRALPGQDVNQDPYLTGPQPLQMSLQWVRRVIRQPERAGVPLPLD